MATARQVSAEIALDEMTECSICTEVFTDHRSLPCIHTFCLKCLLNYGKDRQPGDTMPCPLCRKEFSIPDDGFAGIQKNFFIEQLLYVRKLSAGNEAQHIPCDACSPTGGETADEAGKPAAMHCVQCQQNYCEQCSQIHTRVKATADHVQVEIGKPRQKQELTLKLAPATCKLHKGKEIELFCLECELAICIKCFITSHKNHDCADIEDVSAELRHQVTSDTHEVTVDRKKADELLHGFEAKKNELMRQLADVESEINKTADKLIDAIQHNRKQLLSEVESIRQKEVKQLESVTQEVEHHRAALKSFKRYTEMLLSSGTACDVVRSAKSLHDAADGLTESNAIGHVESPLPCVTVKFTPSIVLNRETGNFLGDIIEDDCTECTVAHVIREGNWVTGVTSLGDDVFVVRQNTPHVEVYDTVTFTSQRLLQVPGLEPSPLGLAVCAVNKCLYASDCYNHSVHRVQLSGSNAVMKWSVASNPVGLSVNSAQNVLVVSEGGRKLQEFTTRGSLVREILLLQSDIEYPRQAVQLSADKFLVGYWGSQHRVCMVDAKGAVVRSYGGPKGSDLAKMNLPAGLAVDRHGNVLVADQRNNRLLVLDPSLSSAHEMSVSVDGGLHRPFSLHYDESRRRLYVGELHADRVIVIDELNQFSALRV